MPGGDYDAALRLAVVTIEPPSAFINNNSVIQAVLMHDLGHLIVGMGPSSVGVLYLRFASWVDREEAMRCQPFGYQGARIDLHREEHYARVPQHACACALLAATGFPAKHLNPDGIPTAFFGFGKVLEIDPLVLSGRELATVRVVVLLERTRDIPYDVWP